MAKRTKQKPSQAMREFDAFERREVAKENRMATQQDKQERRADKELRRGKRKGG